MEYRVIDHKGIMYEFNGRRCSIPFNGTLNREQALMFFNNQSVIDGLVKDRRLEVHTIIKTPNDAVTESSANVFHAAKNKLAQMIDGK